jgi:hypothetical protein
MFVIKLLSLSFYWVLLVGICLTLGFTNLLGYYKCRGGNWLYNEDYSKKLGSLKGKIKEEGLKQVIGRML